MGFPDTYTGYSANVHIKKGRESYYALKEYFGDDVMVPLYIEVEDGLRLQIY